MITFRIHNDNDFQFLREMLFEAIFWNKKKDKPSLEEGLSYDYSKHILHEFGSRLGDHAVIAEIDGTRVGAAFIRYWDNDINTRGYLSENIPVLVIGVHKNYRRLGVGSGLMDAMKSEATINGISEISLCVTKSNIAYQLYINNEFEIVEEVNSSYNMLWKDKN